MTSISMRSKMTTPYAVSVGIRKLNVFMILLFSLKNSIIMINLSFSINQSINQSLNQSINQSITMRYTYLDSKSLSIYNLIHMESTSLLINLCYIAAPNYCSARPQPPFEECNPVFSRKLFEHFHDCQMQQ